MADVDFQNQLNEPMLKVEADGSRSVYLRRVAGTKVIAENILSIKPNGTVARPPLTQELEARGWQRDEAGKLVVT